MDEQAELERFARLVMQLVRDQAIVDCDRRVRGEVVGPSGKRWQSVIEQESPADALLELIPEIVDEVLFKLLDAIDNGHLPPHWEGEDGSVEALREIGQWEMTGWLAGGDWPRKYSRERRHEYFADLRLVHEDE